ncbi:unnamed protein product [Rotaria socialis]|uniref:Uncharacterized protein n=2 Tax=Rotaria socialis TaxID=392032 RepID=A0A821SIW8_9BILA|nr:unnamed protein product [Rotaria socialis]CAF4855919.1 unnamed protein product [Rotaria socialis]
MATALHVEACVRCTETYSRTRSSLCRCNHCSKALCFDCIKEHHDELLQNITQLSHRFNEVQELCKAKQQMIENEALQTVIEIDHWYSRLLETKKTVVENIEQSRKDGQARVSKLLSNLQVVSADIQGLTKQIIYEPTRTANILEELGTIELDLNKLVITKKMDLPEITPKGELQFESIIGPTINTEGLVQSCLTTPFNDNNETAAKDDPINLSPWNENSLADESLPVDLISTTYPVDCLASDGFNVMYTSTDTPYIIAYCHLGNNEEEEDPHRVWYQPRVLDMIYWKTIDRFVCATNKGVYTVEYNNGKFKILHAIRSNTWDDVRVAANENDLWVWLNPGKRGSDSIEIYSNAFEHTRTIKFGGSIPDSFRRGISFSVANNCVASINTRPQNNGEVVQINVLDLDMKRLKSQDLGSCTGLVQIRTDGYNQFFITTGQRSVHCVSVPGKKSIIAIEYSGNTIAVVNRQCLVIGDSNHDLELVEI